MNKPKVEYWFFIVLMIGVSFFSCKVNEKDNVKIKVKPRPTKYLVKKLLDNEFNFNTISTKASVTFDNGKKTSFKTHLRIKKDSVIWMSITPLLGIEMARVIITQDTVKLMNRADSEYFIGDFDYINDILGADLDYQMLEALLIGNSLEFEIDDKIHSSVDRKKESYFVSTEKKRKVKKDIKKEKKEKEKEKVKGQALVLWLDPITFKINELLLSSSNAERTLNGYYSNYKKVEQQLIPHDLRFNLSSKTSSSIEVNYSKISLDKSLTFPFKIPEKYVQIKK